MSERTTTMPRADQTSPTALLLIDVLNEELPDLVLHVPNRLIEARPAITSSAVTERRRIHSASALSRYVCTCSGDRSSSAKRARISRAFVSGVVDLEQDGAISPNVARRPERRDGANIPSMKLALLALMAIACRNPTPAPRNPEDRTPTTSTPPAAQPAPVAPVAPAPAAPTPPESPPLAAAPPKCAARQNPRGCPATAPNINASCSKNGLQCSYGTSCCPPVFVCVDHLFEARFTSCPK